MTVYLFDNPMRADMSWRYSYRSISCEKPALAFKRSDTCSSIIGGSADGVMT